VARDMPAVLAAMCRNRKRRRFEAAGPRVRIHSPPALSPLRICPRGPVGELHRRPLVSRRPPAMALT
jgi:hypothetical protein